MYTISKNIKNFDKVTIITGGTMGIGKNLLQRVAACHSLAKQTPTGVGIVYQAPGG